MILRYSMACASHVTPHHHHTLDTMPAIEIRQLRENEMTEAARLLGILNPDVPLKVVATRLNTMLAEHPHYQIAGAFEGGELAGVCGAWITTKIWCGLHLEIDNLVVDPERRGSGIGTLLIEHFSALARTHGCNALTLDSYAANQASHRLYQRHGFEPWSIHFVNPSGNWTGKDPA